MQCNIFFFKWQKCWQIPVLRKPTHMIPFMRIWTFEQTKSEGALWTFLTHLKGLHLGILLFPQTKYWFQPKISNLVHLYVILLKRIIQNMRIKGKNMRYKSIDPLHLQQIEGIALGIHLKNITFLVNFRPLSHLQTLSY